MTALHGHPPAEMYKYQQQVKYCSVSNLRARFKPSRRKLMVFQQARLQKIRKIRQILKPVGKWRDRMLSAQTTSKMHNHPIQDSYYPVLLTGALSQMAVKLGAAWLQRGPEVPGDSSSDRCSQVSEHGSPASLLQDSAEAQRCLSYSASWGPGYCQDSTLDPAQLGLLLF